jgi:hypothetical protein
VTVEKTMFCFSSELQAGNTVHKAIRRNQAPFAAHANTASSMLYQRPEEVLQADKSPVAIASSSSMLGERDSIPSDARCCTENIWKHYQCGIQSFRKAAIFAIRLPLNRAAVLQTALHKRRDASGSPSCFSEADISVADIREAARMLPCPPE